MAGVKPLVLAILDGWGVRTSDEGNAVKKADTPHMDELLRKYPNNTIQAHGGAVGLMGDQMGNSNVGHLTIGAGRIIKQELPRISDAVADGSFQNNEVLRNAVETAAASGKNLHLFGLLSDGGVHSHITHMYALLEMAKESGIREVYVHAFLDGRDVPPKSGIDYVRQCEAKMNESGIGRIATVMGRYYAMDRDNRWERVKKAYDAIVYGRGLTEQTAERAVLASYERDDTDEFVVPTVIVRESGEPVVTVEDGDSIIFYNFRADRAREITRAFFAEDFNEFDRGEHPPKVNYTCMTQYDETFPLPVAFRPVEIKNTLGEVLSKAGLKQLRIAETEKYAHVTYFLNGGEEVEFPGEDRIMIPSPKVATYDLKPEMSAYEVTDKVLEVLDEGEYDVIIMNYANLDMVGHTGILAAAVKATEAVDECLGRVMERVLSLGGAMLVTADHGNSEQMADDAGKPHTAHTLNPVPFVFVKNGAEQATIREGGGLKDIAPTVLELLGIPKPKEMTGRSLIVRT